jgi:phosphoribosylanthranilate isomerase
MVKVMQKGFNFIKVCGLKSKEEVSWAAELGYTAYGIMRHALSPRVVSEEEAIVLAKHGEVSKILSVVVGVNWEEVASVVDHFNLVQIYDLTSEDFKRAYCHPERQWQLIFAGTNFQQIPEGISPDFLLYDQSRGSGVIEELATSLFEQRVAAKIILAGGLTPENVLTTVHSVQAKREVGGVDVSSGVEKVRGQKNFDLMRDFMMALKGDQKNE